MAKDKELKDASKKRKRDGSKSPSPLADPSSSKVTKASKSDKKDKKDKEHKSDKSDKKEKKEKEKAEKKEKKEKAKKEKKEKKSEDDDAADTSMVDVEAVVEEKSVKMEIDTEGAAVVIPPAALVPFAKPLAEGKLAKKVLKTTKKAAKTKALKRGVKEVVKALRKSPNHAISASSKPDAKTLPLLILAADISPPDVISHLPVLAEDHGIPYIFVTSRAELGAAGATKRPTSVVMITPESAGKKRSGKKDKKDKEDGEKDKGLDKIKEEEDEFRSSYKDLIKDVMGVTRALAV
ncbi:hypothetical protein ABW20_dc0104193 [Dactylellina cionopaga]|nr:hypothetical protein ABW20_dc0104193 [Dactylellina cionopaga]